MSSDGAHVEAITTAQQLVSLATADGSRSASIADPGAAALVAVPTDSGAGAVAVAEGDTLDLRDAATLASTSRLTLPEAPTGMVLDERARPADHLRGGRLVADLGRGATVRRHHARRHAPDARRGA